MRNAWVRHCGSYKWTFDLLNELLQHASVSLSAAVPHQDLFEARKAHTIEVILVLALQSITRGYWWKARMSSWTHGKKARLENLYTLSQAEVNWIFPFTQPVCIVKHPFSPRCFSRGSPERFAWQACQVLHCRDLPCPLVDTSV